MSTFLDKTHGTLPSWNQTLSSSSSSFSSHLFKSVWATIIRLDVLLCVARLHTLLTRSIRLERTTAVKMNARVVYYVPLIIADGDSLHPRGIIFARDRLFLFSSLSRRSKSLRIVRRISSLVSFSFSFSRERGEFEI